MVVSYSYYSPATTPSDRIQKGLAEYAVKATPPFTPVEHVEEVFRTTPDDASRMVFTQEKGKHAIKHEVNIVLNRPSDEPMKKALAEAFVEDIHELLSLNENDIANLTFTKTAGNPPCPATTPSPYADTSTVDATVTPAEKRTRLPAITPSPTVSNDDYSPTDIECTQTSNSPTFDVDPSNIDVVGDTQTEVSNTVDKIQDQMPHGKTETVNNIRATGCNDADSINNTVPSPHADTSTTVEIQDQMPHGKTETVNNIRATDCNDADPVDNTVPSPHADTSTTVEIQDQMPHGKTETVNNIWATDSNDADNEY